MINANGGVGLKRRYEKVLGLKLGFDSVYKNNRKSSVLRVRTALRLHGWQFSLIFSKRTMIV